jgi:tetratricopeptide (TPR) repeat protein
LELDASDWEPLDDLERLAQSNHLWLQFDAVLTELGDRAASTKDRLKLLSRRERITRERLNDQSSAFNLLIQCYRLDVEDKQYIDLLGKDAQDLNTWHWLLPIIEANPLYMLGGDATQVLTTIAELYENKVQDLNHAFDLYCSVFMDCPESSDLAEKLQTLASQTNCFHLLTDAFRLAAALAQDPQQTVALLRRIAAIYETKLNAPERAIDIHRRLLALKEDEMPSLEVVIDWHRSHSEWRDLRDRLQQWVRLTSDPSRHVPYLLEIAQLSERYLLDPERALQTYGQVLEIEPENSIAQQGVKGLVVSITESNLRLRWLQMELKAAPPQRAIELRLEIAQIQEDDMGDISGAIATLQELIQETGPNGPGFKPLGQLLRKTQKWSQLIKLLQAQVEALVDQKEKLAVLQEAIDLCHEHLEGKDLPLSEDLYRSLLKLNPLDHDIRLRLARLLRNSGRFEDLCQHLEESLTDLDQSDDRIAILYELGGITSQNLGLIDQAKNHWLKILEMAPKEEGALLALARTALNQGDIKSYINYRRQQAQLLSPQEAAFVLCHLAEVCDEHEDFANSMIPFYREARSLDPNNIPAMEALKGIGRRLKNLRPAAALLPLEGERELNHRERAKRMKALGDNLIAKDLKQALDWYYRAVAVDPDAPAIWDALANALKELPDLQSSYRAQMGGLQALERSEPIVPDQLMLRADRFYQLALGAKSANLTGAYSRHIQQAYELVPHHPLSALAMAQLMIEENNISGAHSLLHTILAQHQDDLTEEQRVTALYCRGIVLRRLNQPERAMDDLREVLRLKPLYSDALIALGELQAESGRFAAALEHQIRALMLLENPKARAQVHYHIGVLWEDGLKTKDEAGACYELALTAGLTDRDLLHRSLRHFQRSGRLDQSLEVVNGLLPTAHDPEELATLWLVRGEIFAARPNQEEQAIEAFDMALSYNPARQEAREGLIQVLERLEDWHQLLQVLEAGCDVGTPELQSSALQRMADICRLKLNDPLKAEQYLRRSVDISPTRQALEHLEKIYTVESGRLNDRRDILGLLMSFGPPWFDRCMDLGRILLVDEKRWAWCILSPFLGVSQVNPDIKAVVQAMRKEYERPPVLWPAADDYSLLKHPLLSSALTEVLAELGTMLHPLGITSLESLGDGGAVAIGESTNLGKIFSALAHTMGMGGCSLYRTQELPESICIVNTPSQPIIVIRTDVIQQLVHAEVGFLFAYALTLAQPGLRTIAVLTKDNRDPFLPALWLALGFTSSAGKLATKLADRIREVASKEIRAGWAERLVELRDKDPVEQGRIWWKNACYTARRAGLVAGADLRQAFRVLSRLEPELPRPRVVAKPEELDEYVSNSEILQDLVAFAASPAFGKILKNATTVVET